MAVQRGARGAAQDLGSTVVIQPTHRPVKQYAILDDTLDVLTTASTLTAVFGSLGSLFVSFAGSCVIAQFSTSALTINQQSAITMGEVGGGIVGAIFWILAVWQYSAKQGLLSKIRNTSTTITVGP